MRVFVLLALLGLTTIAFGASTEVTAEMTARATDAVDSALQVLYDLRQANDDAQEASDERNRSQQAACDSNIADLTFLADSNKDAGNKATNYRKWLENEIHESNEYLDWIDNRREEIHARTTELSDQRCYGNSIFVRSIKQTSDALEAIALLRNDLLPTAERTSAEEELVQIKDATKKLSMYKNLFKNEALKAFDELSREAWEDNDQEGISLDDAADNTEGRGILGGGLQQQILDLLDRLENDLTATLSELEAGEIKAAWELAVWLDDSEDELAYLDKEEERTEAYVEKTTITLQAAKAKEDQVWAIYFESATTLNNAVNECHRLGEEYEEDKHKRQDETALIDDVIKQFKEKTAKLGADVRSGSITRKQDSITL